MWPRMISTLGRGLLQLLYPARCLLCDHGISQDSPSSGHLCASCVTAVTGDSAQVCLECAGTVGPFTRCPACQRSSFRFDSAVRLGSYDGALREAVLRMKRPGGDLLAVEMGMLFANSRESALRSVNADMAVPVPLHWQPRWLRGHNQAEELAHGVARKLGLACRAHWLRRTRPAVQHAQPSSTARWENVKEAFAVRTRARFAGCTVIVIDDVMTTGSTMSEIARVLKLAGAKRVIACALARR